MTFAEYLQEVAKYYLKCQERIRIGQAYYHCLPTELVARLPQKFDPFYDDSKLSDFLTYIEVHWPKDGE